MFLAATAQAVTGFAFGPVALPLLSMIVGIHSAVGLTIALGLLLTVGGLITDRAAVQWPAAGLVCLGAGPGIPLGIVLFSHVPTSVLQLAIGTAILAGLLAPVLGLVLPHGRPAMATVGLVSGVMLGTTGLSGPPLVMVLKSSGMIASALRGTLQAVFAFMSAVTLIGLLASHHFQRPPVLTLVMGPLILWLGWFAGDRLLIGLPQRRADGVVSLGLAACGLYMLVQGLSAL